MRNASNLRTVHAYLRDANGECRRSGHCSYCETEAAIQAAQEKRRMDRLTWAALAVAVLMAAVVVGWNVL